MQMTGYNNDIGTLLSAGLPNITGSVSATGSRFVPVVTAASYMYAVTGVTTSNASSVNAIYGRSSTVQPASIYTLIIIKV